ncbi:hypothetical protein AB5I41_14925 [Sphingomonas sp. MMS24-JH45]
MIQTTAADLASGQLETAINKSFAIYGHGEYKLLEELELAVGLRYTTDNRTSIDRRFATPVQGDVDYRRFELRCGADVQYRT